MTAVTVLILFAAFESTIVLVVLAVLAISWLVEQITGCGDLGGRALGLPVDEMEQLRARGDRDWRECEERLDAWLAVEPCGLSDADFDAAFATCDAMPDDLLDTLAACDSAASHADKMWLAVLGVSW